MDANWLELKWRDKPAERLYMGSNEYLHDITKWNLRTPAGHPEGFIEAFANIYRNFALTLVSIKYPNQYPAYIADFPSINDGVRGMQFIETVVASGKDNKTKWYDFED